MAEQRNIKTARQIKITPRSRARLAKYDDGDFLIQFARLPENEAERNAHGRVFYTNLRLSEDAAGALYGLLHDSLLVQTKKVSTHLEAQYVIGEDGKREAQCEVHGNSMELAELLIELAYRDKNGVFEKVLKYAADNL